jgi:hypothetical protein
MRKVKRGRTQRLAFSEWLLDGVTQEYFDITVFESCMIYLCGFIGYITKWKSIPVMSRDTAAAFPLR